MSYKAIEFIHAEDFDGLITMRRHIEGNLYIFGGETEAVTNSTMIPFHLQSLRWEQMQLAKAYMLINTIPASPINKKRKLNDQETIAKKLGYKIEICYITKTYWRKSTGSTIHEQRQAFDELFYGKIVQVECGNENCEEAGICDCPILRA